jgi:hypothetical protein
MHGDGFTHLSRHDLVAIGHRIIVGNILQKAFPFSETAPIL